MELGLLQKETNLKLLIVDRYWQWRKGRTYYLREKKHLCKYYCMLNAE